MQSNETEIFDTDELLEEMRQQLDGEPYAYDEQYTLEAEKYNQWLHQEAEDIRRQFEEIRLDNDQIEWRKVGRIELSGASFGEGVCGVLNKLKDKTSSFDNYIKSKNAEDLTMGDRLKMVANTIGKTPFTAMKIGAAGVGVAKGAANVIKSTGIPETYGQIKEKISKGYASFSDYLKSNAETYSDKVMSGDDFKFSDGFKALAFSIGNTVNRCAGSVNRIMDQAMNRVTTGLHNFKEGVKSSSSYEKLVASLNEDKNSRSAEAGKEQDNYEYA